MRQPEILQSVNRKLYVVAGLVESLVPDYDIKQSDPLEAAKSGRGNCVAKAAIGAVMAERMKLVGAKPALAWNTNTHPKYDNDLLGRPKVLNGHAYLLASNNFPPYTIAGISFNPMSQMSDNWEIFDFNDGGIYAEVNARRQIVATEAGRVVGYVIRDWHPGGQQYLEALGIKDSVYHQKSEEELSGEIVDVLTERGVLSSFDGESASQNEVGEAASNQSE